MDCRKAIVLIGASSMICLAIGMSWSEYYGYQKGYKDAKKEMIK